ncbi:type III pantothenate kinase [Granulosicoccaceae sp. 1_MG-2023]|nr:type III pantothenate kinase [Granulosicoccaceae sp. 1_MG-2023]
MKLLIDVGNTRIKSATLDKTGLTPLPAALWRDETEPQGLFPGLWQTLQPQSVLISNVGGAQIGGHLQTWANAQWPEVAVEFVSVSGALGGLRCAYPKPQSLGVDRWVAIRGARARYPAAPVLVLDVGTAATCDLLLADGTHRGGAIFPGINTMRRALAGDTANLNVPAGQRVTAFADNTRDAIAGGTAYALAGALDRFAAEAQHCCGADDLQILLTGGEAEAVLPLLQTPLCHVPDLVLEGLAAIAADAV